MSRLTAAIASVVAFACPEALGREAAPLPGRHREVAVAIVPAEGRRAPSEAVVARLEVMLSNEKGTSPVERALVRKVLAEQELSASGLTDPATAVWIGRLVAADLFLFVEKLPKAKPPACRIRIVETRTGIALGGDILEEASLTKDTSSAAQAVRTAARKLGVPMEKRCYVGVLGFRNEEPGHLLDGLAEALGMLLAHDLASSPSVVLLDREHLDRLRGEKELTGIELKLRTSAVLVDGGIRRVGGKDELAITVLLRSLAGGETRKASVTTPVEDHAAARRAVARAVLAKLDARAGEHRGASPEKEAAMFVRRVPGLISSGETDAAVRAAEAAHTLSPGYETSFWAARAWHETGRALDVRRKWEDTRIEAGARMLTVRRAKNLPTERKVPILAARLCNRRLGLEFYRRHAQRFDEEREKHVQLKFRVEIGKYGLRDPVRKGAAIVLRKDEVDAIRLRRQIVELDRNIFRFKTSYYARHCPEAEEEYWQTWQSALRDSRDLYPGRPDLQVRFIREGADVIASPPIKSNKAKVCPKRIGAAWDLLHIVPNRFGETPGSARTLFVDLYREFSVHKDPLVRICGYCGLNDLKEEPVASARAALDTLLRDLPPEHPYRAARYSERCIAGMLHLPLYLLAREDAEAFDTYCRKIFLPMLEKGDSWRLNEWILQVSFYRWLESVAKKGPAEADAIARKAIQVLSKAKGWTAKDSIRRLERERIEYARLLGKGGTQDPVWAEYEITRVRRRPCGLRRGDRLYYVKYRRASRGEFSLGLWSEAFPDGRDAFEVEKASARKGEGFLGSRVTSTALVGDRFYAGTNVGLFEFPLEKGEARVLTEKDGLPRDYVSSLASYEGKLYLGFGGGFACFDPRTGSCKLIATSGATEARSALDGGRMYGIADILPDQKRKCLWLAVSGGKGRTGLWRYTPATGKLERRFRRGAGRLASMRDSILCQVGTGVMLVDPDRLTATWLISGGSKAGNPLFESPCPREPVWPVVLDGDRIFAVGANRQLPLYLLRRGKPPAPLLHTPDGKDFKEVKVCTRTEHGVYVSDGRAAYLIRRKGRRPGRASEVRPVPREPTPAPRVAKEAAHGLTQEGTDFVRTDNYANRRLGFYYYIPARVMADRRRRHPILVCVPGLSGRGEGSAGPAFKTFADREGFVIVAPSFVWDKENWKTQTSYQYPSAWSGRALLDIIAKVKRKHGLVTSGIYLYGFSAGAQVALRFAVWKPELCVACAAHGSGGTVIPKDKVRVRFFVSVGRRDTFRIVRAEAFYNYAKALGIGVIYKQYEGGHTLPREQIEDALRFFKDARERVR